MGKKFSVIILIFHLIVPLSLLFPVLQTSETSKSTELFNIFQYINQNQYFYISVLLVAFLLIELLGVANAIYYISVKTPDRRSVGISFLFGFSSAILGAMFISAGSYLFFSLCALSFIVISYCSIKLMKLED